jgi:hypothetical protein
MRLSTVSDGKKRLILGGITLFFLVIWLFQWMHPSPTVSAVLSTYREFAVPISWKYSGGLTSGYVYRRSSYLLVPSLREVTIVENGRSPVELQVEGRKVVVLIFVGLTVIFAICRVWKTRRPL